MSVLVGTAEETTGQIDLSRTNFANKATWNRRGIFRQWNMTIRVATEQDANTIEGLFSGWGHHFNFNDNAFSSRGIGPEASSTYTISNSDPVFGRGNLSVGSSNYILWDLDLPELWTVMYWRDCDTTPEHVVVRSDGESWLNGVSTVIGFSELTITNGTVSLGEGEYDDLVVLPFEASASFIEAFYTYGDAFSDLPYLKLSGDIVDNQEVVVMPTTSNQLYKQHGGAAWYNNSREHTVVLEEVRPVSHKEGIPQPTVGWVFDDANELPGVNDIGAFVGGRAANRNGSGSYTTGPFGLGSSQTGYIYDTDVLQEVLPGCKKCTVSTWVYFSSLAATNAIFYQDISASKGKLRFYVDNTGDITVSVCDLDANSANTFTGTTLLSTDTWYNLIIDVDLPNAVSTITINGVEDKTQSLSNVTEERFSDETNGDGVIGSTTVAGTPIAGWMSNLLFYDRLLTPREKLAMYELGKRGVFS